MRRSTLPLLLLLVFATLSGACAQDRESINWTLYTADGLAVELASASREKPQIVLFWATWCPYCKALMPHLQSIRLEYGDEIGVLAVNIKEDGDPVEFIEGAGYDFTLLLEGDAVAAQYEITGTPAVFIVDRNQSIQFDLRNLPGLQLGPDGERLSRSQTARRLAPYWASEIRKSLDNVEGI